VDSCICEIASCKNKVLPDIKDSTKHVNLCFSEYYKNYRIKDELKILRNRKITTFVALSLPGRLMAGQMVLVHRVGVRILPGQLLPDE